MICTHRYIYLPECEHWVEVGKMDEWMGFTSSEEGEMMRPVKRPCCPQCGHDVNLCYRYGDIIKSFYEDLISIKLDYGKDKIRVKDKAYQELTKMLVMPMWKECGLEGVLEAIVAEAARHNEMKRDERWDVSSRINLAYRFACLISDAKKCYLYYEKKNKKDAKTLSLDAPSVDLLVRKAVAALINLSKRTNAGQNFYLGLLREWERLDLQRQLFVAQHIVQVFPTTASCKIGGKPLADGTELFFGDRKLTEDDEDNLAELLGSYAVSFQTNLSSSVKKDTEFVQQLDFSSETWWKCLNPTCLTVFPRTRYAQCPECGGESAEQ